MSDNQNEGQPMSARSETRFVDEKKRSQSRRSASQHIVRSSVSTCCAYCKLPLLIDINTCETLNKSRASATLEPERFCQECNQDKVKNGRSPSSRLFKSASVNWSNMGDNIETWFEKAQTPDQRVVYNFLQQINNKKDDKPIEKTEAKDLDDVLNNLKKYQTRYNSARPRNKLTRLFESSSWRVMRHPPKSYRTTYGNEPTSGEYSASIFTATHRKMGSTYLIHPNWI